ncbi:MAG: hypothetical protein JNM83_15110 [Myxococcales bacterium]|nr:hypothetical protein [Myxococcales bacterium]
MIRSRALASLLVLSLGLCTAQQARAQEPPVGIPEGGERGHPVHVRLDTAATYGIGGQSFLGVQVSMSGYLPIWNTRWATGTFDGGVLLGYGNEPTFLAPWIDPSQVEGATHRISLFARFGHTFHLGIRRRVALGVHLYAGLHEWISSYSVNYPNEGVSGSGTAKRSLFVTGAELDFAYRFSQPVGLYLKMGAPFPYQSSYVATIFTVGAGLTFYLR